MNTPLSREYLLKRGSCCNSNCMNCPYKTNKNMENKRDYKMIYLDDDYAKIKGNCRITNEIYETKKFPIEGWHKYQSGSLVQKAFPHMNADDREFLISRTSPKAWESLFPQKDLV
jgi:hypothetical protein